MSNNPGYFKAVRQFDILSVLRQAGLQYHLSGDDEVVVQCPFCGDDKHRLGINLFSKLAQCFRCGWKGNIIALLTAPEIGCLELGEAFHTIYHTRGRAAAFEVPESHRQVCLPKEFKRLTRPPNMQSEPFWKYLIGRRLQPSLVEKYGIGFCRVGTYRWRVLVPVMLFDTLMTFVARWASDKVPDGKPKVLTPHGSRGSETLFNIERLWGREEVVLVEGVFDALVMPDKAVAVLGSSLSTKQAQLLSESGARRLIICFDPDARGRKAAAKVARPLTRHFDVRVAHLPQGVDPASATPTALREALLNARPWGFAEEQALQFQ